MRYCRKLVFVAVLFAVGCAGGNKGKFTISKEEQEIIDLTNQTRAKEKLPPLKPHPLLFQSARAHAANMAKQKKLEHILDGKTQVHRIDEAGYDWVECGENCGTSDTLDPKGIVQSWLDSPIHRKEIMTKEFDEIGVGIVRIGTGDYYYVQNFGKLRPKSKK